MAPPNRLLRTLPVMILIIMIGFFLRLFQLTTVPLRGDEAFSVQYWAGQPLSIALAKTATIEPHPVLTYALFRGWGLAAGSSEFAMRFLPGLVNLLGIPAIYALGKRLGSRRIGLLSALLFALHPFEIWHAQDARNYAIWAGVSLAALWLGLRALELNRRRDWLLYTLIASLAANIFYTELLTLAAVGVYVIIVYRNQRAVLVKWIAASAVAGGLSIASFIAFQLPLFARGGYTGSIGGALDISQLWTHFLPALNFGEITLPTAFMHTLWPFIVLAITASIIAVWRKNHRAALYLSLLALLPPILLTILSTRLNIFTPRYILAVVPAYIVLFAGLLDQLWKRPRLGVGRAGALVLVGAWLVVAGVSLRNYYFDPAYAKAHNWPALAHYLQANTAPNDVVIQSAADSAFGFYYHQTTAPVPPDVALPETPAQSIAAIETALETYRAEKSAIWQVGQEFPDWPNAGVVRHWLDDHMQLVLAGNAGGLAMLQFKNWQVAPDEIAHPTSASFGGVVDLVGYNLLPAPDSSRNLTLWLYWQPTSTTAAPLKVFVHLLGAVNAATGSSLWTQDDHFPQNGRISTQDWDTSALYRDVYTLPLAGVPNGEYTLEVGFYDPASSTRLSVGSTDSLVLQTVQVK